MRIFITYDEGVLESKFDDAIDDLRKRFEDDDVSFAEADIAPGASLTAILAEYKETLYLGIPISLFFAGKKIEENLVAWIAIMARCLSLLKKIKKAKKRIRVTVDNQTAAIVAFNHALTSTHSSSYRLMHILGINGYIQEILDCTDAPIDERHASSFLYYLCFFELDDYQYYEVIVNSSGEVIRSGLITDKAIPGEQGDEDMNIAHHTPP